jgi:hypothetical protein
MDEQEDWLNVEDEEFKEKHREDRNLVNLFADKALVVFGNSLTGVRLKDLLFHHPSCLF